MEVFEQPLKTIIKTSNLDDLYETANIWQKIIIANRDMPTDDLYRLVCTMMTVILLKNYGLHFADVPWKKLSGYGIDISKQ
jgi:hypothetical protein